MPKYTLEITTDDREYAGKWDCIFVTIFGSDGQSDRTELGEFNTATPTTATYTMNTKSFLGTLLLVKVEREASFFHHEDEWYCSKIVVTTDEEVILFPCYRSITRDETVELRGGRAMRVFDEDHPLALNHRRDEIKLRKSLYQWAVMAEGLPYMSSFRNPYDLPAEVHFSEFKSVEESDVQTQIDIGLHLKGKYDGLDSWRSLEDMKQIFVLKTTPTAEYVADHWKDDAFFGWQFLNGANPNVIKRCSELPANFPVTGEMVEPFLEGYSLHDEMESGNIFLYDQKKMDGIPTRDYYGKTLYVTPGLCLFYLNSKEQLMPIAIQLQQQPSCQNPIFLPSDTESDWLLAKMFIKNADFMDQEAVHHLMNTHFLAEVYAFATLRCLPAIHPLYKLLVPHFRHTLYINTKGRLSLFGSSGVLRNSSLGVDGLIELMRRALSETTYSSLCLPDNIAARGLESIPKCYYRDDGLQLWNIINKFVTEIVEHYYSDSDVRKDTELGDWISEIFYYGFLGNEASGVPKSFGTVEELVKFVTMVIFTTSAQHAAVNNGQFDYHAWVPNGSLLLRTPPPTTKGETDMDMILEALPNVGETFNIATMTMLLTEQYGEIVPLGAYPEERFSEREPKQLMKDFQEELLSLNQDIAERNESFQVPYTYLKPDQIETSITI